MMNTARKWCNEIEGFIYLGRVQQRERSLRALQVHVQGNLASTRFVEHTSDCTFEIRGQRVVFLAWSLDFMCLFFLFYGHILYVYDALTCFV